MMNSGQPQFQRYHSGGQRPVRMPSNMDFNVIYLFKSTSIGSILFLLSFFYYKFPFPIKNF